MFKQFILSCLLLLQFAITAQEKKAITHEDLWLMKRVDAPAISPDGKWVIFGVMDPAYDTKDQVSDIYICPSDGSASPRKITAGKAGESAYAWSPDGKTIAFVAKREGDEVAQIYLLNIAEGGEAQRFTALSTGASGPNWSPDGKSILFSSSVYPTCFVDSCNVKKAKEEKDLKYKARVYDAFPIQYWDAWNDDKVNHFFIQGIDTSSKAKDIFSGVKMATNNDFSVGEAIWSPDSKSIYFTATLDMKTTAYQESTTHIYKLAADGGDATPLTSGNFEYGNLSATPDGTYLFATKTQQNINKVYNLNKLVRFDLASMRNEKPILADLDRPIGNYKIAGDKWIASVSNEGKKYILEYTISSDKSKTIAGGNKGSYSNVATSINGDVVVANYSSVTAPDEVVKINKDGSHTLLTNFNGAKLSKLDLPEAITFYHKNANGRRIRSMLIKPAGFDPSKKYPIFVVMHGGPAGSWGEDWGYRWNYHMLASPGYALVLTDYTGSTGYGEKFSQDIQFDPFRGPANEINDAVKEAIKQFPFLDASRQAVGGASYGGHLANWMQATTTHYKCIISHAGLINSVSQWGTSDYMIGREYMNGGVPWGDSKVWKDQNPFTYAEKFKTPMLITVGERDFRVPMNNSIESFHVHQRLKIPSKLIVFPDANHWVSKAEDSRFFYKELHSWLAKWL